MMTKTLCSPGSETYRNQLVESCGNIGDIFTWLNETMGGIVRDCTTFDVFYSLSGLIGENILVVTPFGENDDDDDDCDFSRTMDYAVVLVIS